MVCWLLYELLSKRNSVLTINVYSSVDMKLDIFAKEQWADYPEDMESWQGGICNISNSVTFLLRKLTPMTSKIID